MSRYCLDTSAYSHFRRGHRRVTEIIDRAEWIGMPAITLGEVRAGFLLGDRETENAAELLDFLVHPAVEVVAIDDEVSDYFAEIVVDLRRVGSPLPTNDIWIAACSVRWGAAVLTYDRHFELISRVGSVIPEL